MSDTYRHHTIMSWVLSLLRLNIKCMPSKVIIAVPGTLTKASGGMHTLIVPIPAEDVSCTTHASSSSKMEP